MRKGCLSLIASALILFTAAFGTGAVYVSFHDATGHSRRPHIASLLLLILVLLIALGGSAYMIWLDLRNRR